MSSKRTRHGGKSSSELYGEQTSERNSLVSLRFVEARRNRDLNEERVNGGWSWDGDGEYSKNGTCLFI